MDPKQETKEARYDQIIALRDEGKIDEALKAVEKLVADYPDYPLARLALAVFYDKKKMPDSALSAALKACELEPENSFYYTALSSLAIRSGHHKEAEDALMKAQEIRFNAQLKKIREEQRLSDEAREADPEKKD